MTLQEVAQFLRAQPRSWADLTPAQKDAAEETLLPKLQGFDGEQRAWFNDWWLACSLAQVNNINALLPESTRVEPITIAGQRYLNIDLITDVIKPGDTYYPARTVIRFLVCVNVTPP